MRFYKIVVFLTRFLLFYKKTAIKFDGTIFISYLCNYVAKMRTTSCIDSR